jgi:hypothetical protein
MTNVHCCDTLAEAVEQQHDDIRFYPPERDGPRYIAVADGFTLAYCPFCGTELSEPYRPKGCPAEKHCCFQMDGSVSRKNVTFHRKRKKLPKYTLPRKNTPINYCPWCKNALN